MAPRDTPDVPDDARRPLTDLSQFRLAFIPPPADLAPFVTTFYHLRCDLSEIRDMVSAGVGYLIVVVRGSGRMMFADGHADLAPPTILQTPASQAAMFEASGPLELFGAALSPLGWAALTGLAADRFADCLLDAEQQFGAEVPVLHEAVRARAAAGASDNELAEIVAGFIRPRLKPLNPRHVELVTRVGTWLSSSFNPALDDLRQAAGYSERQVERLVRQYFGVTPRELVRKYRIARVAALLQAPDTSAEQAAELLNLFYDQSHFIREMRRYIGRTPTGLAETPDSIIGQMSSIRVFREVKPNFARIPGD